AFAAMPRRLDLIDFAVFLSCPIDPPACELADAFRAALAQQGGKILIAESAPGLERIKQMQLRTIRLRLAERRRAGHLRHNARTAAADDVLVEQNHLGTAARGSDSGEHACCST